MGWCPKPWPLKSQGPFPGPVVSVRLSRGGILSRFDDPEEVVM
jgi:hypothetical protein